MKYITTVLLLFCLSNMHAQGLKLAGVEYLKFPNSAIVDAADGQEVAFQEFRAFVNIPIKMKNNKTILLNGLNYDFLQATLQNSPLFGSTDATKNLHSISYSLSLIHKWNKWTMLVQVKPTIASDFEDDFSDDDLLFQGTALLSRRVGKKLGIGLGAIYTTATGEPQWLPAIQFKLQTKKNTLDVLLPTHASYMRHFGARGKLSIGILGTYQGNYYNVSISEFPETAPENIEAVKYSRVNIGPVVQYKLTRIINVKLFGGLCANRTYQFSDVDGVDYEYDSENSPFFSIGVNMMVPKKVSNQ